MAVSTPTRGKTIEVRHGLKSFANASKSHGIGEAVRGEADSAESGGDVENAEEEAGVADTIYDERFFACVRGGFFEEVETDQQIAAQAHTFPAHKQEKKIVGEDQGQHGKHEQVHVAEETVVAAFVAHVADGVDVDEESDAGNDQNHDAGKRIEQIAPIGDERDETSDGRNRAGADPFKENLLKDTMGWIESEKRKGSTCGVDEGKENTADAEEVDRIFGKETAEEKH